MRQRGVISPLKMLSLYFIFSFLTLCLKFHFTVEMGTLRFLGSSFNNRVEQPKSQGLANTLMSKSTQPKLSQHSTTKPPRSKGSPNRKLTKAQKFEQHLVSKLDK